MNPLKRLKNWFIGDYLAKTEDVFEKARIELTYDYCLFFFVLALAFYGNLIANGLWYHFYIVTFGCITLPLIPFILKYKQNLLLAGNYYVAVQTITSSVSVYIQEGKADMSGSLWTMSFIIFILFIFGAKRGFVRLIPFLSVFLTVVVSNSVGIVFDFNIPESQQLPNQPFVTLVPFSLCVYLIVVFLRTNNSAEKQINEQKDLLQSRNKDVTDSINYAQKIQHAVLPNEESIYRNIPLSFIVYKPRDIVSGDFFWFHEINPNNYILVCADCTGHGVPGAMMTVVGSSLLNQIVVENKISSPSAILSELDKKINAMLKQEKERQHNVQDGMDLALIKVDKTKKEFIFTSAKRPAIFIRNKQMQEFKGSKASLGGMRMGEKKFEEIRINYLEDDIVYLYTDGYTDQFGGPKGKKFSSRKLKEYLLQIHHLSMAEQKIKLESAIDTWKGNLEQVDDIQIIGIRF